MRSTSRWASYEFLSSSAIVWFAFFIEDAKGLSTRTKAGKVGCAAQKKKSQNQSSGRAADSTLYGNN
jgi:hypothetical protein